MIAFQGLVLDNVVDPFTTHARLSPQSPKDLRNQFDRIVREAATAAQ
jgi:hypothetical protein